MMETSCITPFFKSLGLEAKDWHLTQVLAGVDGLFRQAFLRLSFNGSPQQETGAGQAPCSVSSPRITIPDLWIWDRDT